MRISRLSAKCKKLAEFGIVRAPEYDFEDDGNYFKGWCWEGKLPISQLYSDGSLYLTIREDYVIKLPYEFWSKNYKAADELADKWNGVAPGFELEDFAAACKTVWEAIQDAQKAFAATSVDGTEVVQKLKSEIAYVEETLGRNLNWFEMNLSESGIKEAHHYYTDTKKYLAADNDLVEQILSNKIDKVKLYSLAARVADNKETRLSHSQWYADQLNELIDQKSYNWYYITKSETMK